MHATVTYFHGSDEGRKVTKFHKFSWTEIVTTNKRCDLC